MQSIQNSYKHESTLVFSIKVDGEVSDKQIFGALYGNTDIIENISLSRLQATGEAGRCLLERSGDNWLLKLPITMPLTKAALLAAAIESIDEVAKQPASFRLIALESPRERMIRIARRAKELSEKLIDEGLHVEDNLIEVKT
ncbi:MAG: hypothetical protein QXS96_05125 [Candidatus Caldarchaeum sp.]|jgi:hypothetical protein|uniref:Uncharacterized protein n=1 Tax=Caldiarchaeum subterraneum TaxID=311458 RepID=A0A7J3G503_CALS0